LRERGVSSPGLPRRNQGGAVGPREVEGGAGAEVALRGAEPVHVPREAGPEPFAVHRAPGYAPNRSPGPWFGRRGGFAPARNGSRRSNRRPLRTWIPRPPW